MRLGEYMKMAYLVNSFLILCSIILFGCDSAPNTSKAPVDKPKLVEVQVTPVNEKLPIGLTQNYIATAIFDDQSTTVITDGITWTSSDPFIATINSAGQAKGLQIGNTIITASGNVDGIQYNTETALQITNATISSLDITPDNKSIPVGLEQQFIAIATLSDGSKRNVTLEPSLVWSSAANSIATIQSGSTDSGRATAISVGTTTISASGIANGVSFTDTANLTVTNLTVTALSVSPDGTKVPAGLAKRFTATALLSDGSTLDVTENSKVNWSSADTKIASVGNSENIKGLVYGVSTGNTSISASGTVNGLSYTSSANITISDAVITDLQVTPPESSITERLTKQYTATARFSDGTTEDVTNNKNLYWSSDNTSVATISSSQVIDNGIATGIKAGVATITASGNINNRQFNATSLLSVTESVTIPNVGTFSKPDNTLRNWQDASNYCASPGIIGNWRLPTNAEIIALINYGGSQGTDSWLGTILGWNTSLAWSSTLNSANGKHYSVLLRNGITDDSNIDAATLLVTCIRN